MSRKRSKHDEDYVESEDEYVDESDGFDEFVRKEGGKEEEGGFVQKRGRGAMRFGGKKGAAGATKKKGAEVLDEDAVVFHNYSNMTLKPDHMNRPIWITPDEPPMV